MDKPRHEQVHILDKSEVGCMSGVLIKLKYSHLYNYI